MHIAFKAKNLEIIMNLLEAGGDLNTLNNKQ